MEYLIGLDIGTSSVKGVLMTKAGKVISKAHESFKYISLLNGGSELVPDEYLSSCYMAIKKLAKSADGEICGICASSASGNLIVLDKELKPATNIISWQDKRVTTEAKEILGETDDDAAYKKIGWPLSFSSLPLAQLCYIKKHNPEVLKNAGMVAMSTEYLCFALTGKWGISSSAGTPFILIDQQKERYISEFLEKLDIDEEILPPIKKCGEILGYITENASKETGLPCGLPVILGSFDHPSAARGAGVLNEGEMLLSCGTSWVGFFPVKEREKTEKSRALIDPFLSDNGGCFGGYTSLASISERIKIYVNRYIDDSKNAFDSFRDFSAKSVKGAGGLIIDPRNEPDDELILKYPKEHIARAVMEGTIRLLKEKLESLKENGITAGSAVMVGGPSENPMWIKVIEEICGIPVKVVHGETAGAVGAAILAGIGTGLYKDEYDAQRIFNL